VEPLFLTLEEVQEIHEDQIRLFGGMLGIRDEGALASAVAQAEAWFGGSFLHSFPFGMAAAYAFHIAEAQAFLDGNKRRR
jgi:death-on-curing protein